MVTRAYGHPFVSNSSNFSCPLNLSADGGCLQEHSSLFTAFYNAISVKVKVSQDHLSRGIAVSYSRPQEAGGFGTVTFSDGRTEVFHGGSQFGIAGFQRLLRVLFWRRSAMRLGGGRWRCAGGIVRNF